MHFNAQKKHEYATFKKTINIYKNMQNFTKFQLIRL